MSIENSDLNDGPNLKSSNAGLTGGSGDGNRFVIADLEQGYVKLDGPVRVPHFLPQNDDSGENYIGDPFNPPGGFLGRPEGWER